MPETPSSTREFTITRIFEAPRRLVFRAWTDPQHLAQWFGPVGLHTPLSTVSMDVRPGGEWRLRMVDDTSGSEYPVSFTCREVKEPERLVLSSPLPDSAGASTEEALLTVTFADLGDRTEMTFHVAGLPRSAENVSLEEGWSSSFERLAGQLKTLATAAAEAAR